MILEKKIVFHLPEFCIKNAEILKCDNYNFRKELVATLAKAGADYFYSIPAKTFIRGSEFACEHLIIYAMEDSYYTYIKIFQDMVCKYHSSLEQDYYYYECEDYLVSIKIGCEA